MAAARLTLVNCLQKCKIFGYNELLSQRKLYCLNEFNRKYNNIPLIYSHSEKDPAPLFFSLRIQKLLKHLTRPDHAKVFRKRTNKGEHALSTPEYKFMTDEELKEEMEKVEQKADYLLQMPPVVKVFNIAEEVISVDPAITDHDKAKFIFTDITFGVRNSNRFIVVRESDGTLHHADVDTRKRLNQVYFPMFQRSLKEPAMFSEVALLNDILERKEYEFTLDRACLQYEPDDPTFQKVLSQVYQHCDQHKLYDLLRSTRHFGPMAFYFAWHNIIDGLLLELIETGALREGVCLISLQQSIHPEMNANAELTNALAEEILSASKSRGDSVPRINESDIALDNKCIECVESYIQTNSSKKAQQELALQNFRDSYNQKISVEAGIRHAHGLVQQS